MLTKQTIHNSSHQLLTIGQISAIMPSMSFLEQRLGVYQTTAMVRRQIRERVQLVDQLPSAFSHRRSIEEIRTSRSILQGEYAVTNALGEIPIIGTYGLATCIAVTAYDKASQTAGIAHLDTLTKVNSLEHMLHDIQADHSKWQDLEIRLIGGMKFLGSLRMIAEIADFFTANGISITSSDIIHWRRPSEVAIDARTGMLYPKASYTSIGGKRFLRSLKPTYKPLVRTIDGRATSLPSA